MDAGVMVGREWSRQRCAPRLHARILSRLPVVPGHRFLFRVSSLADRLAYLSRRVLPLTVLSRFINLFFLRFPPLVHFVQSLCAS